MVPQFAGNMGGDGGDTHASSPRQRDALGFGTRSIRQVDGRLTAVGDHVPMRTTCTKRSAWLEASKSFA